jgi:hypothetical protein
MDAQRADVQIVFKKPEPSMIEPAELGQMEATVAKLSEVVNWFKGYKVDSIELDIEASGKIGSIPSLFLSAEGKGGMKVILKPK